MSWKTEVLFQNGSGIFCAPHCIQEPGQLSGITGWMVGGFESRQGMEIFLFPTASRPALGPVGTRGPFPGEKAAEA
jgi:hypothetical protein